MVKFAQEISEIAAQYVKKGHIRIAYQATPIAGERIIRDLVHEGKTLKEILDDIGQGNAINVPEIELRVTVNGTPIEESEFETYIPTSGSFVTVKVLPGVSAVIAVAAFVGTGLAAVGITGTIATIISYGVAIAVVVGGIVGLNLVLGQLLAPSLPSIDGADPGEDGSPAFLLTGGRNEARPFGPVPRIYGSWRYHPNLASRNYTDTVGSKQFLRQLFTWGYGPLQLSGFKIGESDIGGFFNTTTQTVTVEPGQTIPLFPEIVTDNNPVVLLKDRFTPATPDFSSRFTDTGITRFHVTFLGAAGLARFASDGKVNPHSFTLEIRFKEAGDASFTTLTDSTIEREDLEPYFLNFEQEVAEGQYEIGVRIKAREDRGNYPKGDRGGTGTNVTQLRTDLNWVSLKSFKFGNPVTHSGTVLTALRIQASEQLKGQVDSFNGLAESELATYTTASGITNPIVTRNPAWIALDILRGTANPRPVPDAKIDLDKFLEWANFCDDNSFTCDIVFDFRTSVLEAFNTVARVGLASHTMNGEKFSIVIDDGDLTPTQLFTLRNSRNLTVKKIFPTKVDAVRVRFADREKNFKTREVIVFSEGQTLATATEFESLDHILGITEVEKLNKHVKYELAAARLRPEIFQWDVSLESAIAERGDVVLLRHDVVLIGTGQARVASVVTNSSQQITELTLDDGVTLDPGVSYGITTHHNVEGFIQEDIAVNNPITVLPSVVTGTLTPLSPIASGTLSADDMIAFGPINSVSEVLKIVEVEQLNELQAKISAVVVASGVLNALTGDPLPIFDPGISTTLGFLALPPAIPIIHSIRKRVLGIDNSGSANILVSAILSPGATSVSGSTAPTANYLAQYRQFNDNDIGFDHEDIPWITLPEVNANIGKVEFQVLASATRRDKIDYRTWAVGTPPRRELSVQPVTISGENLFGDSNPPTDLTFTPRAEFQAPNIVPILKIGWIGPGTTTGETRDPVEFVVRYSINGGFFREARTYEEFYDVQPAVNGIYDAQITSLGIQGLSTVLSGSFTHVTDIPAPTKPTGLELDGLANGEQFGGKHAKFLWRENTGVLNDPLQDDFDVQGGELAGADNGAQHPFFKSYEIRIFDVTTTSGTDIILRTENVLDPFFVYTHEKNTEDGGPRRKFKFSVAMRDVANNLSDFASLTVENSKTGIPVNIDTEGSTNLIQVKFDVPQDLDNVGVKLFRTTTSGFDPSPSNLVAEVNGSPIQIEADPNTDYVFRLGAFDAFGSSVGDIDFAPEFSVLTPRFLDTSGTLDAETGNIFWDPGNFLRLTTATGTIIDLQANDGSLDIVVIGGGAQFNAGAVGEGSEVNLNATLGNVNIVAQSGTVNVLADGGPITIASTTDKITISPGANADLEIVSNGGDMVITADTRWVSTATIDFGDTADVTMSGVSRFALPERANNTTVAGDRKGLFAYSTGNSKPMVFDGTSWVFLAQENSAINSKHLIIELPGSAENIGWFYTEQAITVQALRFVNKNTGTVTISAVNHDLTRSGTGNNVLSSGVVVNDQGTGNVPPVAGDTTIPSNSWVWIETSAQSGTVDSIQFFMDYNLD